MTVPSVSPSIALDFRTNESALRIPEQSDDSGLGRSRRSLINASKSPAECSWLSHLILKGHTHRIRSGMEHGLCKCVSAPDLMILDLEMHKFLGRHLLRNILPVPKNHMTCQMIGPGINRIKIYNNPCKKFVLIVAAMDRGSKTAAEWI